MRKEFNYKNELWDGRPIECRVVNITVADEPEFKYYWGRPYVGQMRQALEVKHENGLFYIDNEGGSGIYKVVGGAHMGKGHRSLSPEPNTPITDVDEENIIYPTKEIYDAENNKIEVDCQALYGSEYMERTRALKETIAAMKNGTFDYSNIGKKPNG